eukprot:COSAG06_NODE_4122_length_4548_cov_102.653405_8_plen_67_part_00
MGAGQCGGRGMDWCWGNVIGVRAWSRTCVWVAAGSRVRCGVGACMRRVECGGHSHYYESSEQLVIQ